MSSVTATINVQINAANAAAQLTALQGKVAAMNKGMLAATAGGVMAQEKAIKRMGNVLGSSGMFTTGIRNVHTELGRMHKEFDRGSTTLQHYRQNSKMWGKDHSAINRLAADRVRMLQSQYVALGKEMNGVQKAMQIKPTGMMREFGADAMYATQQQMLFRRNLQMGSTALVNWGKNTQWAGRQMMVGMGIPIALVAAGAIKSFNDIEKSSIAFKRVYGDTTTTVAEKSQMLAKVQQTVGKEMLKYGVSMADTLDMSARAAATGAKGADLIAATRETMRLATLGNMDYNKSLDAVIAMQTAFNIKSSDMAKTTDFLNAVENQTILSMQDMAVAVPRVAPVIKGLGGNVQDLAVMMTALRQGGVSAEQGANALKSGLGSLLNPTSTAIKQFDGLGINLQKIVDTNKGDIIGTLQGLGKALDGLTKYDRQRALEGLFGKYQYSRMGALLKNINSKAAKETMKLAKTNAGELARMSNQELSQISDSPMIKLKAAIEGIKAAAAPLGAVLSDIAAKIVNIATPIVSFFSNNDIAKWALIGTAGIAALAGTFTMVFGVLANFAGSMVKAGMSVKNFFRIITGRGSLAYITSEELEASAAANSLATAAERAGQGLMAESRAAQLLTSQLNALSAAQLKAAGSAGALASAPLAKTAVVPKPSGPGGTPIPPAGVVAPLSQSQSSQFASGWDRAHAARPMILRPGDAAYDSTREYYKKRYTKDGQLVIPNTDLGRILNDMIANKSVLAYNAEAFLMQEQFNRDMDSGKGASASEVAKQARSLGPRSASPYFFNLARAAGNRNAASQAAFLNTPEIRNAMSTMYTGYTQALVDHAARNPILTGQDFERITAPVLEQTRAQLRAISPEMSAAVDRLMLPGFMSSESQSSRTAIAEAAAGGISWGKAGNIPEMLDVMPVIPGAAPTPEERSRQEAQSQRTERRRREAQARIERNSSADIERRRAAVAKSRAARLGGQKTGIRLMEERAAAGLNEPLPPVLNGDDRGRRGVARPPRQFTGNGMMGVGMLAQTAMMGMEMAGKQVPMAAQFAANGLMGVGMAAQMMPDAFAKLATPLMKVVSALGPVGIAVGAVAAAIGGTALLWRKINIDARARGIDLGNAMNNATDSANDVATAFGNTSYVTEQAAKDAGTTTDQMTMAQQFLASEVGKSFVSNYTNTAAKTSAAIAQSSAGMQIASWIVQGVLKPDNLKGLFAALNQQSPGLGTMMAGQAGRFLGKGYKANNPAAVANSILKNQSGNISLLEQLGQRKVVEAGSKSTIPWWQTALASVGMGTGPAGAAGMMQADKIVAARSASQETKAAVAAAWSSQMKTAFTNRAAAQAQINMLIDEQSKLQKKASRGVISKDEQSRLATLNRQIPKVKQSMEEFNQTLDASYASGERMAQNDPNSWYSAMIDSARRSKDPMAKAVAESINDAFKDSDDKAGGNRLLNSLMTGAVSPAALSNLSVAKEGWAGVSNAIATVPVSKINEFGTALQGIPFQQSQRMMTNFGSGFRNLAKEAGMTKGQMVSFARALGASDAQIRRLRGVKTPAQVQQKVVAKPGQTRVNAGQFGDTKPTGTLGLGGKVNVKAKMTVKTEYEQPKNKIKAPKGTVKIASKFKQPENKIKKPDNKVNVPTKFDQPDNKIKKPDRVVQPVDREIGKENLPKPDPTEQATNRALGLRPELVTPSPVTQIVNRRVVGGSATGGPFTYAAGGIHNGDGKVTGPGGPTDDKVNARLSNGEYVIRASSVQKYGKDFMNAVNTGAIKTFKSGGIMSKAGNLKADEKKSLLDDSNATIREVNAMSDMTKALKKVLGKGKGGILYDIVRSVMDSFDPKQIKELFKNKGKLKTFGKAFVKQQQLDAKDQLVSAKWDRRAAVKSGKSLAFGASGAVQSSLSADDMKLSARMPGMWDKILTQRTRAEKANQNAGFNRQISRSDASIFGNQLRGNQSLAQAAEALGVSLEDIANKLANSKDYDKAVANIIKMGNAAKAAKEYMDALAMSDTQRTTQRISNNDQRISNLQALAAAKGRQGVQEKFGKSQSVIEAENAVSDAQNAIAQAQIDDINEKYDKQLNILDQIGQHQQAIANLERGRMSVANALSQGDIAAAASAAQQQRNDMAQFARDQMRNQLENQQKAATAQLQQQINDRMRVTRDYQNQIALITAEANANQAVAIGDIQAQSDGWMTAGGYVTDMNAELERQNGILALTTAQLQAAVQAQAQLLNVNPPTLPPASGTGKRMSMSVGSGKGGGGKGHKGKGKGKAFGGFIPGVGNSDSVPTMLTPGEFVVRKAAAAKFGPMLKDMNYGSFQTGDALGGGDVKIDNVVFNINGANLNEREVADIAVRKMHSLNSATIRGGRF